jgi:hypothetical protein
MNFSLKPLVFFVALALSPSAHALDEDALLQDYIGLTKLLRASGVDPIKVGWNDIEYMCLPLKTPRNALDYNRCRYEKAVDQTLHRADTEVCNDEVRDVQSNTLFYRATDALVFPHEYKNSSPMVVACANSELRDLRSFRRYSFDRCMSEKGWRNSRHYQFGRQY